MKELTSSLFVYLLGTLTLNKMVLQEDTPTYHEGENQASVLMFAAMAAKWKEPPRDALDRLTLGRSTSYHFESFASW